MATHSSILAWRIPWSEEPGGLQSSSIHLFSHVWLFATPWTAACQASLPIANSRSSLKLMSIELLMPSNHLILCRPCLLPLIFPASGSFLMSQFFESGGEEDLILYLQDLLELISTRPYELTTKKCPFHHRGLECKSRKSKDTWSNGKILPWSTKWSSA